jgi:hypothetical protein
MPDSTEAERMQLAQKSVWLIATRAESRLAE